MTEHKIQIEERLYREFTIRANSSEEAFEKAQQMWRNSEVVLTADDFTGASISVDGSAWYDL